MSIYFYQSIDIRTYSNDFLQSVALIRTTFPARDASFSGIAYQISKDLIHNRICLSSVSGIRVVLILDVPALALEVDWRGREQLAQGRRLAVRANGHRRIVEGAPELELGVASVAVVSVERHQTASSNIGNL